VSKTTHRPSELDRRYTLRTGIGDDRVEGARDYTAIARAAVKRGGGRWCGGTGEEESAETGRSAMAAPWSREDRGLQLAGHYQSKNCLTGKLAIVLASCRGDTPALFGRSASAPAA
jgi:hypothetical protein